VLLFAHDSHIYYYLRRMTISKRKLTKEEAEIIAEEIKRTPNIIGYRPNELVGLNDVFVAVNNFEIVGLLAYVETGRFVDLKIFLVREKFRNKGFGKLLFDRFIAKVSDSRKPIYTVTKNQAVIHLVSEAGFKKIGFLQLPYPVIMHQIKMIFSTYRIREYVRKSLQLSDENHFSYWIINH